MALKARVSEFDFEVTGVPRDGFVLKVLAPGGGGTAIYGLYGYVPL